MSYSRNDWTKTAHMRAIDVWVVLCYIGIFSALIEYCAILYLTKNPQSENKTEAQAQAYTTSQAEETIELGRTGSHIKKPSRQQNLANRIERITRFLLLFYNITFPIVYFAVCTFQ